MPVHKWGKGKEEYDTRLIAIFIPHICSDVKQEKATLQVEIKRAPLSRNSLVVAGAGFEPATFGL